MKNILVILMFSGCMAGSVEEGLDGGTSDGGTDDTDSIGSSQLGIYASGSRIKMRVGVTPDGAKTFIGWYDSVRRENCGFTAASDGVKRCIPTTGTATFSAYFSDVNCSVPLAVTVRSACNNAPAIAIGYAYVSECPIGMSVYPIFSEFTQQVYAGTTGTCSPTTASNFRFWTTGPEILPSEFQEMEEQIE